MIFVVDYFKKFGVESEYCEDENLLNVT